MFALLAYGLVAQSQPLMKEASTRKLLFSFKDETEASYHFLKIHRIGVLLMGTGVLNGANRAMNVRRTFICLITILVLGI